MYRAQGWWVNYKVPFGRQINITIQAARHGVGWKPGAPEYLMPGGYVIVRGCENLPVTVGTVWSQHHRISLHSHCQYTVHAYGHRRDGMGRRRQPLRALRP